MEEISDVIHPGAARGVRMFAWTALFIIVGTMLAMIVAFFLGGDEPMGDPGRLEEAAVDLPPDLAVPPISDATEEWGLDAWITVGSPPLRGGVTLADLDGDGDLDLAVAGGSVGLYEWVGDGFVAHDLSVDRDAISVHVGDLDEDGNADLLIGATDGATIVWGGRLFLDGDNSSTDLGVAGAVTAVVPVDLGSGPEVLLLGYGGDEPAADLLIPFEGRSPGVPIELPDSRRRSMVAAVADVDGDDLADIWVGRDVGWASGADSIYSRSGPSGAWSDVAASLGADLEIDAMGLTVADLDQDGRLDAYLSDLGDNELLLSGPDGYEKAKGSGAARIRSAEAEDNEISSSWGSGAADWNLDGIPDLVVVNGGFSELSVRNKVVNTFILGDDPPAILLGTRDGTYVDVWPLLGLAWEGRSRGLSLGDIDGDGDIDAVVVDHEGGLHALRNGVETSGQVWVAPQSCLVSGTEALLSGPAGNWTALTHQLSFLGAHAAQVVVPPGTSANPDCS